MEGYILKSRTFFVLNMISFGLFVAITLISARLPAPISEQAVAGKRVWQRNNCISCHTLFGNGGYEADDLTNITTKNTPTYLVDYLVHPPVMRPNKRLLHPSLDEADAKDLVQYLEFVHTIPTLGWPPQQEKAGKGS